MVDAAKREFITNLKQLMHVYNNIKEVSKKNDDSRSTIFRSTTTIDEKIPYEF